MLLVGLGVLDFRRRRTADGQPDPVDPLARVRVSVKRAALGVAAGERALQRRAVAHDQRVAPVLAAASEGDRKRRDGQPAHQRHRYSAAAHVLIALTPAPCGIPPSSLRPETCFTRLGGCGQEILAPQRQAINDYFWSALPY